MKKNKFWFTLIELIVIVIILTILATLALLFYQWYLSESRDSIIKTDIKNIESSFENYYSVKWEYPNFSWWTPIAWTIWWKEIELDNSAAELLDLNKLALDPKTKEKYKIKFSDDLYWYKIDKELENGEIFTVWTYPKTCKEIYVKNNAFKSWDYTVFPNWVAEIKFCDMNF